MGATVSTEKALSKFRWSFVATNMVFAAIVLVAVCAVIIGFSYQQRVDDVNEALERGMSMAEYSASSWESAGPAPKGQSGARFRDDGRRESGDDQFIAVASYTLDLDGNIVKAMSVPWTLDDSTLTSALGEAYQACTAAGEGQPVRGFIRSLNLHYLAKNTGNGTILVSFASGNYVDQGLEMMWLVILAAALAFAAFFVMSLFLSRRAVQPVERAWRQQQQFVADASHELKTPLTVILANNSLIMADKDATVGSQMQWIESTETEAKIMQGLVNDMIYLAKSDLQRPEKTLGQERVNLSETVESAALTFESVAFDHGVSLDEDVAPDLFVRGDASGLLRMVSTLIDNACKYADKGGSVLVKLTKEGSKARLAVNNTGAVIDPEDLPHLFDRFYRADKTRTPSKGGFGLGLSIAQSIVDQHKGTIAVESDEQHGTTFTVTLPLDG